MGTSLVGVKFDLVCGWPFSVLLPCDGSVWVFLVKRRTGAKEICSFFFFHVGFMLIVDRVDVWRVFRVGSRYTRYRCADYYYHVVLMLKLIWLWWLVDLVLSCYFKILCSDCFFTLTAVYDQKKWEDQVFLSFSRIRFSMFSILRRDSFPGELASACVAQSGLFSRAGLMLKKTDGGCFYFSFSASLSFSKATSMA